MNGLIRTPRARLVATIAAVLGVLVVGILIGRVTKPGATSAGADAAVGRKALYWYDPMVPAQHFDKPGKSPFMDMQLVPKYASEAGGEAGLAIDPARTQSLGIRLATVERRALEGGITATGVIDYNARDIAIVQAEAAGFVQRVYGRAPDDVVAAGAPLADLLVPTWAGAQGEFLAVLRTGDAALIGAARQRLRLLGMPPTLISAVERSGEVRNVITVSTPLGGAIKSLNVRIGMTVGQGHTLAEINGLSTVWLNAAVPEALAGQVRVGATAMASLTSYPGETFSGRVTALLPQTDAVSRTLTARIELPNRGQRLRPGMFASVRFGGAMTPALIVPSEALIRTGKRTLVMVAKPGGQYLPAEVTAGREMDGKTEIFAGLSEGEKVVASGQFLIESEASLTGVVARPIQSTPPISSADGLYRSVGRVEQLSKGSVTLSHQPVPALQWPAMTMTFRLSEPTLTRGLRVGDRVTFAFSQAPGGPTVREMAKETGQ